MYKEDINQVRLKGTILRKIRKDNQWLCLTIRTNPRVGKVDTPTIFWYGEMIDIIDDAYKIGDQVTIDASIITSKRHQSESVIGSDINDTPKELDTKFGVYGEGRYEDDENEVRLMGKVDHVYVPEKANGKFVVGTIKTVIDNKISFPQVMFFQRQKDKALDLHPGDRLCILGHIQTKSDELDGKRIYHQSIVCDYVQKISDEEEEVS